MIEKAFQFALDKHEGQYRKGSKTPYITHPFAVGMILTHHEYSDNIVAAGILHDTLEDTDTTEAELLNEFGQEVLELIKAASEEDKSLSWEERKRDTINKLSTQTHDELAIILADKLHNIRSIKDDFDKLGDAIWDRFNRGKTDQAWYYSSIVKELNHVAKEMPLVGLLDTEVKKLF